MLLSHLHRLPNLTILFLVVVVITALLMAAPHIGRRLLRLPVHQPRQDAALDGYKAVMSMIGVVLAFSLVQANANISNIEATVGKEAAAMTATDRVLLRTGRTELANLRPALARYAKAIIEDEWPDLANGDRSDEADEAYKTLSTGVRALSPIDQRQQMMFAELLKDLDDLADLREQILADSETGLPEFFWITTTCLLGLAAALAAMASNDLGPTVAVGASAAAVALLLGFVVIVDGPFEGETSVSFKPIANAIQLNARRI